MLAHIGALVLIFPAYLTSSYIFNTHVCCLERDLMISVADTKQVSLSALLERNRPAHMIPVILGSRLMKGELLFHILEPMGLFQPDFKENTQKEVHFKLHTLPSLAKKTLVRFFVNGHVRTCRPSHAC